MGFNIKSSDLIEGSAQGLETEEDDRHNVEKKESALWNMYFDL